MRWAKSKSTCCPEFDHPVTETCASQTGTAVYKHEFVIQPGAYDLSCAFFYLQRDLFPQIRDGVRPGGVPAGVIHLAAPGHNPAFAPRSGEPRKEFDGWKMLYYSEAAESSAGREAP
jgi:hypothetical protein